MNGSDNLSSAVVLPDENYPANSRGGMGCAHISRLISVIKSNSNNLCIVYDPNAAFRDVLSDAVIIFLPDNNTGGQG
ncbi:hypothetical protein [Klebsiella aerogenes]|uniref:hypothetical protein n=1 Tax=Klebsiella aerogenes TaxID=548 RepID=UPI0032DA6941